MNVHKNAHLTPHSRAELVRRVLAEKQAPAAVATAFGVSVKTVGKWVDRFQAESAGGLTDRSSRPRRLRAPTSPVVIEGIEALRRQRWTGKQIAREAGVSLAIVRRVLKKLGLNKLSALEPAEPVRRNEREHPRELIHIDIKKLDRFDTGGHRLTGVRSEQKRARGAGWENVRVCIDDHSHFAFT